MRRKQKTSLIFKALIAAWVALVIWSWLYPTQLGGGVMEYDEPPIGWENDY